MRTYKDKLLEILDQLEGFNVSDEIKYKKLRALNDRNSDTINKASPEIKLALTYRFGDLLAKYYG